MFCPLVECGDLFSPSPCKDANRSLDWLKCRNVFTSMTVENISGFWILKDSVAWKSNSEVYFAMIILLGRQKSYSKLVLLFGIGTNIFRQPNYLYGVVFLLRMLPRESQRLNSFIWEEKDSLTLCYVCLEKYFLLGDKARDMLFNKTLLVWELIPHLLDFYICFIYLLLYHKPPKIYWLK